MLISWGTSPPSIIVLHWFRHCILSHPHLNSVIGLQSLWLLLLCCRQTGLFSGISLPLLPCPLIDFCIAPQGRHRQSYRRRTSQTETGCTICCIYETYTSKKTTKSEWKCDQKCIEVIGAQCIVDGEGTRSVWIWTWVRNRGRWKCSAQSV